MQPLFAWSRFGPGFAGSTSGCTQLGQRQRLLLLLLTVRRGVSKARPRANTAHVGNPLHFFLLGASYYNYWLGTRYARALQSESLARAALSVTGERVAAHKCMSHLLPRRHSQREGEEREKDKIKRYSFFFSALSRCSTSMWG